MNIMQFTRIVFIFLIINIRIFSQIDSTVFANTEVMVIDSYITPETPNKFVLSFFTSDSCTSKLLVMNSLMFEVSKTFSEDHKIELELGKLKIDSTAFRYQIIVFDRTGRETRSEYFEISLPVGFEIARELDPGLFSICLGATIFAIPSPAYVISDGTHHWSLNKEIPLINFYSLGYNYPAGYIGVEYSYVFESERKNFLRIGYKQIFQVSEIKYISPGINYFTDFRGYNGLSAELSIGLFQIQNVFTLYSRYRYNFQLISSGTSFHEISLGLYSNFFSLNL
ncbi:hypothetical protein C0389_05145 [bacterium]|nr:hypothetical protein [bacterium]